jgi:hypothetical protein
MPGTVTVACKMPNGMILRVFQEVEVEEPAPQGSKRFQRWRVVGEPVRIMGPKAPHGMMAKAPVESGAALTFGVDADFFNKWLEQNKELDIVRKRLIYGNEKQAMVSGEAKEQANAVTGLEALVPDTDYRIPRTMNPNVGKLQSDDGKR